MLHVRLPLLGSEDLHDHAPPRPPDDLPPASATLHHDRPTTSGRRRPRSLDIAIATALSVGLLGGAATAAHAEVSSTGSGSPAVADRPALPSQLPGSSAEPLAGGVEAQQSATVARAALPVEHPGIDGSFTGVLDLEDDEPVTVGTYITWTAELANTGDVEIRTINGIDVDLAPGETTTNLSWRKQVTQADLDAGTATISFPYDATTASGLPFTSPAITGTLTLPIEHPGLTGHFTGVLDVEDGEPVAVGTWITWTADLTNTGDVELRRFHDVDVSLAPGENTTNFGFRSQVTQADLDAGTVSLSHDYTATTPRGTRYTSPAITGTLALPRPAATPALTGRFTGHVEGAGDPVRVGTWITWIADLTNTGDVALTRINDTRIDLLPGETAAPYRFRTQVTQADLDAGTIDVSRTFSATTPDGRRWTAPAVTGSLTIPAATAAG